jgi:putative oxidoreductase
MISTSAYIPRVLSLLRIVSAFLFVQHGTAKFFGMPHVAMFDGFKVASLIGVAGTLELVGGTLLLIGLFSRPVAFVLSGFMAVAYFMAHATRGFVLTPILNQGELAIMFCFVFLFISVAGGGAWSVDAARGKAAA